MNWESVDAFLAMGGYGLYVWGSYAVTFGLLAVEMLLIVRRRRDVLRLSKAAVARRGADGA
ncbi:MAG: heme exporter protein CcmD [Betaproteobacteria bacterium]